MGLGMQAKETYYSVERDLLLMAYLRYAACISVERDLRVSKETYYSVERDLLQCRKRPTTMSKETYYSVKRDLLQCRKRPKTDAKETYYHLAYLRLMERFICGGKLGFELLILRLEPQVVLLVLGHLGAERVLDAVELLLLLSCPPFACC
jgi:hypothetical protein